MFPQLRERIGPALDIVVEFSTLGEYRLDADGVLRHASALTPTMRSRPARPGVERVAPEREPQLGGAGVHDVARAAVRRIVAGGAAGGAPVATPAARRLRGHGDDASGGRRPARRRKPAAPEQRPTRRQKPVAPEQRPTRGQDPPPPEQLCLAV